MTLQEIVQSEREKFLVYGMEGTIEYLETLHKQNSLVQAVGIKVAQEMLRTAMRINKNLWRELTLDAKEEIKMTYLEWKRIQAEWVRFKRINSEEVDRLHKELSRYYREETMVDDDREGNWSFIDLNHNWQVGFKSREEATKAHEEYISAKLKEVPPPQKEETPS